MADAWTVRPCVPADHAAIREINRQAFKMLEPGSFEKLLLAGEGVHAWVAQSAAGEILGHVIFTPVSITGPARELEGAGLGELAVLPTRQRQGIGTLLGRSGIDALREAGCPFVIVVGHAQYYPRFGFRPGRELGLRCQWEKVPDPNFMALILDEAAMSGVSGVARFRGIP
jgi:putative acetyltransferase